MNVKKWRSKVIAAILAMGMTISLPTAPIAEAAGGLASAAGVLISGGIQASAIKKELKKANNTEEGRRQLLAQLKAQYGVNDDAALNDRLDNIMTNLTKAVAAVDPTINDMPYNYFINNETSFNAFCALGRNLSVNTGVFSALKNDDEIAVVLGHEMGHGQKNHPYKGVQKQINAQILAQAAGAAIGAHILGVLAGNAITHQGITKPQEWEADNLAFEYITHSNYNPGACAAVWQRAIDVMGEGKNNSLATILAGGSDHPSEAARRDNYAKKLTAYSNGHVTVEKGLIKVSGQLFTAPVAHGDMSAWERSYFVAGNLAAAYHNKQDKADVTINDNTIMLGNQPIITVVDGDTDIKTLAATLKSIKGREN